MFQELVSIKRFPGRLAWWCQPSIRVSLINWRDMRKQEIVTAPAPNSEPDRVIRMYMIILVPVL